MEIEYSSKFLKDMKSLRGTPSYLQIKELVFERMRHLEGLYEIPNCIPMEGYENFYRIRAGDYRIGLKLEGNKVFLMRVLHRKEIYRYFP